jgi:hypothetical protein
VEVDRPEEIDQERSDSTDRLNYFNYFTEVEEEFVRRRGKPLIISPLDWALVESWKNSGIPLHVVLRAINRAFDARDSRSHIVRVNTIFYCEQAVEESFAEHRLSQVGGASASPAASDSVTATADASFPQEPFTQDAFPQQAVDFNGPSLRSIDSQHPPLPGDRRQGAGSRQSQKRGANPFPREVLLDFINRCDRELERAGALATAAPAGQELAEAIGRARNRLSRIAGEVSGSERVDAQAIERDFDSLDRLLLETATRVLDDATRESLRSAAESQLRRYRKKMDDAIYQKTLENFITRRIRELHQLPRLSLFYL